MPGGRLVPMGSVMGSDDRIAASLPQPPLPAPARRTAAIEAALRRFDGEQATDAGGPRARAAPWWRHMDYRQVGALASIALVAVIALPLAWTSMDEGASLEQRAPPSASVAELDGFADAGAARAPTVAEREDAAPGGEPPAAAAPGAAPSPTAFAEAAPVPMIVPLPEPLAKVAAGPARYEAGPAEPVALAAREARSRAAAAASSPTPPPPAAADVAAADAAESSIIVTGVRASMAKAAAREDWNACTVNDPRRNLQHCGHVVDPSAEGAAGRAAAQLADGLSLAWRGEVEAAIRAFDRAIEQAPNSSFAYLNRGLAHRRNGDLDRALADLDRAVRSDPGSARAYYVRSQLLRQNGKEQRARADEDRAVQLDPRYAPLVGGDRTP